MLITVNLVLRLPEDLATEEAEHLTVKLRNDTESMLREDFAFHDDEIFGEIKLQEEHAIPIQ